MTTLNLIHAVALVCATDSIALVESPAMELAPNTAADFELLTDARDGLLRVRQKATRADAINKNRRVYPRKVLQAAVDEANKTARAGAMLCEYVHPEVVVTPRGEKYVDNPDRKCARVDEISDVDADGWVHVTRTILDTPKGRAIADRFLEGKPPGISTRWMISGKTRKVGNTTALVADSLRLITFDDVEDPAVDGAGEFELLNDSVLQELSADEDEKTRGSNAPEVKTQMNENLKRLRDRVAQLITDKAAPDQVMEARKAFYDELVAQKLKGDVTAAYPEALRLEADMVAGGYRADKAAPTFLTAADVGDGSGGWGSERERNPGVTAETKPNSSGLLTDEQQKRVAKMLDDQDAATAASAKQAEVKSAVDSLKDDERLKKLTEDQRELVIGRVLKLATDATQVSGLVDDEIEMLGKILAPERLQKLGFVKGNTVDDPSSARIRVGATAKPWMEGVDKLLGAADDWCRSTSHEINPDDADVQKRRKANRLHVDRMMEEFAKSRAGCDNVEQWFAKSDAFATGGEKAFMDCIMSAAADATTMSQMFNQPTIMAAFLTQSFQDMQALDFIQTFGPGNNGGAGGWEQANNGIGSVLRIPVEYYTPPSNYGAFSGFYDAGLLVPENTGIDEATVNTMWLPFAPAWRRIAASLTRDAVRAMGNGPANYPLVARTLFHMAYDKSRRVDKAILDEMLAISDEYGAVTASAEAPSLANQSVYLVGGSVQVNLNPAKTAVGAIVLTTDNYAAYGANVVAAIRLKTRGNGTSSPYMGTANGPDPTVRPRVVVDLNASGQATSTTNNPFTVAGAGAQVMGYLDVNNQIQQIPGAGSPTFAVDWENGVVVFNAAGYTAAGWGNAAGVLTGGTATFTYAYATNFDNFIVNNPTLGTGITLEMYLNGLVGQMDQTAALMGSAPRYVKPNLGIMSLQASTYLTRAQIFYKLASPEGTELFPTPEYFGGRTGLSLARINAPWNGRDRRILMNRKGSTKYGIDTPFELRGPYPAYDANGKIVARDIFYGEENSVVCTPQVKDQAGTIMNPVARTIILR